MDEGNCSNQQALEAKKEHKIVKPKTVSLPSKISNSSKRAKQEVLMKQKKLSVKKIAISAILAMSLVIEYGDGLPPSV